MKIFSWMQNKLTGKPVKNEPSAPVAQRYSVRKEAVQEEFSDWPEGLLTIGTFGKNEEKEISEAQAVLEQDPPTSPDLDFTPEEVEKLQDSLKKLLSRKSSSKAKYNKKIMELPLDKFLNCPSSLEVERRLRNSFGCDSGEVDRDTEEDINKTISVIIGKCKEVSAANKKKNIGKKLVSFLLKKTFVCSSGFMPAPSLGDTLQETRMEKLLRAMIYRTRFPQPSTSRTSSATKYLENKPMQNKSEDKDERRGESSRDRSKWVKTDSEFIVLEI